MISLMSSEKQFEDVTPITGSGPVYVIYFASILKNQRMNLKVEENEAPKLALQLLVGASSSMLNEIYKLETYIDNVYF